MKTLTYNSRLQFDCKKDSQKLIDVLIAHREAFNIASKIHFGASRNSIVDLHKSFYRSYRESQHQVPSQVVIRAEQECLSAYRSIKSNKHKIESPVVKKKLSMRLDKRIYSYKKETFSIVSLEKRVKCKLQLYKKLSELLFNYKFYDPLIFVRNGEVWISLSFEVPEKPSLRNLATGVDLGIRNLAATSEGILYKDRKFNQQKRSLRYRKQQLQSKGTKSAKRSLKKIRRKEQNKNKDLSHKLANKIIKESLGNVIVLEDLSNLKKKRHKYQNLNRISQIPFAELRRILTYKAPINGKTVIVVNPAFTSQIDSRSGLKDGIRKGRRYICSDGVMLDADCNAACNIAIRSKLPVSYGNILDGQASVNTPIVG